jgi:DNA gyrase inhibitor GyrI
MSWASACALVGPQTRFFTRYFDDPQSVTEAALRADAGITVEDGVQGDGNVRTVTLPALAWPHCVPEPLCGTRAGL